MSVDAKTYRQIVGNFSTGIAVVTAGSGDNCHAVTVNSFTSVSLDPILLLVCLTTDSRTRAEIVDSKAFNINILGDDQETISRFFAKPQEDNSWVKEFNCTEREFGAPLLPNCLATLQCLLTDTYQAGDHTIMIGAVQDAEGATDGKPLLFFRGKYGELGALAT